jgi:hypothetical protein
MSTAGKVLTVIVMLMIVVWIVLMAKVDDLNRNWGEELAKQEKQAAKNEEDLAQAKIDLARIKTEVDAEQVQKDKDLMVLRRKISALETAEADTREILTRVKSQLAEVQLGQKNAEAEKAQREKEKADLEKTLADTQADSKKLQDQNASLLDQLNKLHEEFTGTVAENRRMIQQMYGGRTRRTTGTATR